MSIADPSTYLADTIAALKRQWPENRTVNLVCHGHSVPAGYFATPVVDTFNAYPHLLHAGLKERFPNAVINVIVTAIGGENSQTGAARFACDVLGHRPDVVTLDYALNDRRIGLSAAAAAWRAMIEQALAAGGRVILLTPTLDMTCKPGAPGDGGAGGDELMAHAQQVRQLAADYGVGLADSTAAFAQYMQSGLLDDLLSWPNHPNRRGHALVVERLLPWFVGG
ncbi:MAG: SGNH/GDSL hydrolase family protein [Phycisphaeraceae bacterium]